MDTTTFTFRPRNDNLTLWNELRKLCFKRGISISNLFNTILLQLVACLSVQPNKEKIYDMNLGVIKFQDE